MTLNHLTAFFGALFLVLAASAQGVRREPVFDPLQPAVHDPVAIRCGDIWYLFSTGFGISVLSSQDLKSWEPAGRVFDTPPQWALDTVPGYHGHTWAIDPNVFIDTDGTGWMSFGSFWGRDGWPSILL